MRGIETDVADSFFPPCTVLIVHSFGYKYDILMNHESDFYILYLFLFWDKKCWMELLRNNNIR